MTWSYVLFFFYIKNDFSLNSVLLIEKFSELYHNNLYFKIVYALNLYFIYFTTKNPKIEKKKQVFLSKIGEIEVIMIKFTKFLYLK